MHTLFCTFGTDLYAQSALVNKISASELSRKFIRSALLVGNALCVGILRGDKLLGIMSSLEAGPDMHQDHENDLNLSHVSATAALMRVRVVKGCQPN